MTLFTMPHLIYWITIFIIILIQSATFGRWWRRQESYRWTLGYFTVFSLGIPLIMLGYWDATTWLGLFFGVGLSGAAKLGFERLRANIYADHLRRDDVHQEMLRQTARKVANEQTHRQ